MIIIWPLVNASERVQAFDHALFDSLLQKYVARGLVNYQALKANPVLMANYLKQLEQVDTQDFENWQREEKIVFWINAYNAITIEGILRNYPIDWGGVFSRIRFPQNSIRQIGDFWDTVFIKVMGRDLTLNQIEHEILRKQFDDARIHFAIVCASIGCPVLESRAFFTEGLEQRLDQSARNFINDPEKVRLDKEKNILYLSSILDWYKEDFIASDDVEKYISQYDKKERGVIEIIIKLLPENKRNYIKENQPEIKYLDYDWSLNEQK
jgi:hypothetical protein